MRTLIYKRTHLGDPDLFGTFGINDCMGEVRARQFDAVIGVGGIGDWLSRSSSRPLQHHSFPAILSSAWS